MPLSNSDKKKLVTMENLEKFLELLGNSGGANGETYGVSVNSPIKCTTTANGSHTDFHIELEALPPETRVDYYGRTYTMDDIISALRNLGQLQ